MGILKKVKSLKYNLDTKNIRDYSQAGNIRSKQKGFGIEFSEYRPYVPSDNPKYIDWKHYGKTDRLYVKESLEEKCSSISFFIDSSNSMQHIVAYDKNQFSTNLVKILTYIGLNGSEEILIPFSPKEKDHLFVRRFKTMRSYQESLKCIDSIFNIQNSFNANSIKKFIKISRGAGLIFFISDFLFPASQIRKFVQIFSFSGIEVIGIQILGKYDLKPFPLNQKTLAIDSETMNKVTTTFNEEDFQRYSKELKKHTMEVKKIFNSYRFKFFSTNTNQEPDDLVCNQLIRGKVIKR